MKLGQGCEYRDVPVLTISEFDILVKIDAVALNPIDYKYIDLISPKGSRIGGDYAGVVTKVGASAKGDWKVGDRVAGFVHGGISANVGVFAEYIKVEADLAWKVPAEVTEEAAATYGVTSTTAMLALNVHLEVPYLDEAATTCSPATTILVYSGSTAVGIAAIQIAKAAGYRVVTTASPHSFDLVKSYGADVFFNYRSATAIQEITTQFPDITIALDCISEDPSSHFCAQVLAKSSGKVITLLDNGRAKVSNITYQTIMVFTVFGAAFEWLPPVGPAFPAQLSDRDVLVRFYANLPALVPKLRAPPLKLIDGNFDGILMGLNELRKGVSGKKLVVKLV